MLLLCISIWLPLKIQRRRPRFKPETVLDFGSGLGTAIWYRYANLPALHICLNKKYISNYRAVDEIWKKSVYEYLSVDTSEDMENLANKLRRG